MPVDESNESVLTPAEVALMFRVTPDAVRQWADSGKLPHFRTPGGQRRFRRADVEALTASVSSLDSAAGVA